jgi:hypothetical protein
MTYCISMLAPESRPDDNELTDAFTSRFAMSRSGLTLSANLLTLSIT